MKQESTNLLAGIVALLEEYRRAEPDRPGYADVFVFENILAEVRDETSPWYGHRPDEVMSIFAEEAYALFFNSGEFIRLQDEYVTVMRRCEQRLQRTRQKSIQYTGHGITVEDGSDFGAITYTGFLTDEEACQWAEGRFPNGTWRYAPLCVEMEED